MKACVAACASCGSEARHASSAGLMTNCLLSAAFAVHANAISSANAAAMSFFIGNPSWGATVASNEPAVRAAVHLDVLAADERGLHAAKVRAHVAELLRPAEAFGGDG